MRNLSPCIEAKGIIIFNSLVTSLRVIAVLLFCFPALILPAQPCLANTAKWRSHVDITAKPGSDRSLGKLDFFVPIAQTNDRMFFTDIRGVFADDPSQEGNFTLGFRSIQRNGKSFLGDWLWALYASYDRRRSENDFNYNQGAFGAELLGENFDLRTNIYFPEDDENEVASIQGNLVNETRLSATQVVLYQENVNLKAMERALPGFDLEAGYRLPLADQNELWIYGGYFRFEHDDLFVVSWLGHPCKSRRRIGRQVDDHQITDSGGYGFSVIVAAQIDCPPA